MERNLVQPPRRCSWGPLPGKQPLVELPITVDLLHLNNFFGGAPPPKCVIKIVNHSILGGITNRSVEPFEKVEKFNVFQRQAIHTLFLLIALRFMAFEDNYISACCQDASLQVPGKYATRIRPTQRKRSIYHNLQQSGMKHRRGPISKN